MDMAVRGRLFFNDITNMAQRVTFYIDGFNFYYGLRRTKRNEPQRAGYVDEHFQPLLSRTQAALLADAMAERLGIKEKWKVFEGLWNRKYMRSDYNLALSQQQSYEFQDELKQLFS
jgi:hypothetical protein